MSRIGYKKNEPVEVFIDSSNLFTKGYEMHKKELQYSDNELSDAFHLPLDIINKFCNPNMSRGKLRVVA